MRRHRRKLLLGGLLSVLVVGLRLSLPWLFRGMLAPLLSSDTAREELSSMGTQPLIFGVLVLGLLVALGLVDYLMRLQFAQFAIGVVRDLRARAFQSALHIDPRIRPSGPGDLVARLIGDTARVKEGLKGFLVHVCTNGLMLAGVSVVLLWVHPGLGAIFAAAFALIGIVVAYGATRIYWRVIRVRTKEGLLAESIHGAWQDGTDTAFADLNQSSGRHEATVTRLQGRTTWAAHALFGVAVLLLILFGTHAVMTGNLSGADMLVFILYALMTRAPAVQLARQGTRTGKILACANRLEQVIRRGRRLESAASLPPLMRQIRVDGARVVRPDSEGRRRRLRVAELVLPAGSRVAVVGASAAGKSALLQLLAGTLRPRRGVVWWDDVSLLDVSMRACRERIVLLPQEPRWSKQPLWHLLGLRDAALTPATHGLLKKCGAARVLDRLPDGLETEIASEGLAVGERRDLMMGRVLLTDASVILLDDPFRGLARKKARRRLRALLDGQRQATVIVAAARLPSLKRFDRIIVLKKGKVVFDGRPEEHRAHRQRVEREALLAASFASVPSLNGGAA